MRDIEALAPVLGKEMARLPAAARAGARSGPTSKSRLLSLSSFGMASSYRLVKIPSFLTLPSQARQA